MTDKKKVVAFTREVPKAEDLYPEKRNVYIASRWWRLQKALDFEADYVVVAFPEVLGDDYLELVVNLGKIYNKVKHLNEKMAEILAAADATGVNAQEIKDSFPLEEEP